MAIVLVKAILKASDFGDLFASIHAGTRQCKMRIMVLHLCIIIHHFDITVEWYIDFS